MSKEEMREGFEAWHCEQYKTHGMTGAPTRDLHNGVYSEKYCVPKQQALWECWQETGGDVAKVEALKEEIERVELGKKAVVFLMLGDIFHGVDGPEVDDWDIQYDHKVCNALAQMNPGAQIPLFTRSDAGEIEQLREAYVSAGEREHALREELAQAKEVIGLKHRDLIEAQTAVTGWAAKFKAAERRNAAIVGKVDKCKECGSDALFWFDTNTNTSGIAEGRLRTSEVTCTFVLGCADCSATMRTVRADTIAARMTAALNPEPEAASHD